MKTEWPYLIHEIKRIGKEVIFCNDCPLGHEYRLPKQHAKAVSEEDIDNVNSYRILYTVIKRVRADVSGYLIWSLNNLHFQMSLATLSERLEHDAANRQHGPTWPATQRTRLWTNSLL